MAASASFALRQLLSLLPLPRTATKPPPPPPSPKTPLLPLCSPFPHLLAPLSYRRRPTLHSNSPTSRLIPVVSVLLPAHAEALEEQKGGAFGWIGPSTPSEVLFACYPAAALANVLYAKSGYYNAQVVVSEDEPEDRLVERFRRASSRAGVFRECRRRRFFEDRQAELKRRAREAVVRRAREAVVRRAREASRLRRIAGYPRVAQITGGFTSPPPLRGKKKKKKREKRPQLRETQADEEEEDNWELPEGEIPYCR